MSTLDALETATVTIASGASLSSSLALAGHKTTTLFGLRLFAIVIPSSWTAANLTFQASFDGGTTYVNLYDDSGVEIVAVSSTSRAIVFRDPTLFSAIPMLKIRSGTSATPVNQEAARTLTLILRSI